MTNINNLSVFLDFLQENGINPIKEEIDKNLLKNFGLKTKSKHEIINLYAKREGYKQYNIFVPYKTWCAETISDNTETDRWGFREDLWDFTIYNTVYTKEYFTNHPEYEVFPEIWLKPPVEKMFLVYVQYSTGDTFSHSSNRLHLVGIYEEERIAKKTVKEIEQGKYGEGKYLVWNGYFERMENVDIKEVKLVGAI